MKTQKIYTLLHDAGIFSGNINALKVDALKRQLEIEIAAEQNKATTTKSRIATIKKYFDKLRKQALNGYSTALDGYYSFSDSWMLCSLKQIDFNGLLFEDKTKDYPDLTRICDYNNFENYPLSFTIKINDLLNDIKLNTINKDKYKDIATNIIKYKLNNNDIVGFSCENMKLFITCMNLKPDQTITFYSKSNRTPFFIKNENGSKGLILPVRL